MLFSEARTKSAISVLEGGHRLYTNLNTKKSAGVGILVHQKHVANIIAYKYYSDRVIAVDIQFRSRKVRFVSVYVPHCGYTEEELHNAYDQMRTAADSAWHRGLGIVVGGDFNTQLGLGLRGILLNELADAYNMNITNGNTDNGTDDSWTFCSSMGAKRRLDYILASSNLQVMSASPTGELDLGSDHRAVHTCFNLQRASIRKRRKPTIKRGWKPALDLSGKPTLYHNALNSHIAQQPPRTISDIERIVLHVTTTSSSEATAGRAGPNSDHEPWQQPAFQQLLQQRRASTTKQERADLSKQIKKELRRHMRQKQNKQLDVILSEFVDLDRTSSLLHDPVKSSRKVGGAEPSPSEFASFLGDIFASTSTFSSQSVASLLQYARLNGFAAIPSFRLKELQKTLQRMKNRKCADKDGILAEMLKYASPDLQQALLDIYNGMLSTGCLEPTWQNTLFSMLPKSGDLSAPGNWRPIAILKITYKIFSRLIYQRLRQRLEEQQSCDQCGFRPNLSVDDAFVVLDTICGKALEWNMPLWFASLDLRKAFDRIEYGALFSALESQGVDRAYLALLASMYNAQTGSVQGGANFPIQRGVKQGDIISPLLFNAGLEMAVRRWKTRLVDHGIALDGAERLTNVRYADDLVIYAKTQAELCEMLEILNEELDAIGLSLNASKTKVFTTTALHEPLYIDVAGGMVEVLLGDSVHKYLGRHLCGDMKNRSTTEFMHRVAAAWGKFHKHRPTLMNKHASIKKRLRFFESVVSPTVLFGLSTLPLTSAQLKQLDALQRRMLRSIAGWVRNAEEDWAETMRKTNRRLEAALRAYPVKPWTQQLATRQFKLAAKFANEGESWPAKAIRWNPQHDAECINQHRPYRLPGRPRRKWDDFLSSFSASEFTQHASWLDAARGHAWLAKEPDFLALFEHKLVHPPVV